MWVSSNDLHPTTSTEIWHAYLLCLSCPLLIYRKEKQQIEGVMACIRANAYPTLFLSENHPPFEDVSANNKNINSINLPSCSYAVNVMSPYKEIWQEDLQHQ
ncbi:hypothetical protein GWI33_001088 [Rhynchophorus ferrugineus]|uniref:Uncharacterized protein n=1 Tax=Rhynchophorus ferrugineus TaxID=354439 RepID=A0A834IQM6_RHYFE|nr:hypothetical protein GWI33_001088 [Rhynchophorus ferrugineus]